MSSHWAQRVCCPSHRMGGGRVWGLGQGAQSRTQQVTHVWWWVGSNRRADD